MHSSYLNRFVLHRFVYQLVYQFVYQFVFWASVSLSCVACGVRGKPQPPLTPAELGRGQPDFKRASEEFANPNVPSPESTPQPTPPSVRPRPTPLGF